MNERIRELIKQHEVDITIDGMGYGEGHIEGLAELIVNECIDYCGENLSKTVGAALKIHFGVKE